MVIGRGIPNTESRGLSSATLSTTTPICNGVEPGSSADPLNVLSGFGDEIIRGPAYSLNLK
jgi:hypothetical protein